MPGILPMKVIKMGSSAPSRVAQACDRCRSKKIRCDGIRPSCTQCTTVGFECRISDTLSRRAFPRGYTECLEERIRTLESEVRELKDLLDEKEEKMDMLSKLHSHSPPPHTSAQGANTLENSAFTPDERWRATRNPKAVHEPQQSRSTRNNQQTQSSLANKISARSLVDALERYLPKSEGTRAGFDRDAVFNTELVACVTPDIKMERPISSVAPPRLLSDHLVNVFFQEWAPLFPVLHRPTFFTTYERFLACAQSTDDKKSLAQMYLVFGIAALSCAPENKEDIASFENQWRPALDSFLAEHTIYTLQCLVLAQLYCIQKADSAELVRYKGLAIAISSCLGLHQSQRHSAQGLLEIETRKKVFWTLYTLDCFSAASLGLPKSLKEREIDCESPVNVDDEYLTNEGFITPPPGHGTRISSALALFRLSRILSHVLSQGSSEAASCPSDFTTRNVQTLSEELEEWSRGLDPNLKLRFLQDKPCTDLVSSQSPIISLAYYYTRMLIHSLPICTGLGDGSSTSNFALADSCKRIIQIIELLDERRLSFSMCLDSRETLIIAGFGILLQALQVDQNGRLIRDYEKSSNMVLSLLMKHSDARAALFRLVSSSVFPDRPNQERTDSQGSLSTESSNEPNTSPKAAKTRRLKQRISRRQSETSRATESHVHVPLSSIGQHPNSSKASICSASSEPVFSLPPQPNALPKRHNTITGPFNLDYLAFDHGNILIPRMPLQSSSSVDQIDRSSAQWGHQYGAFDASQSSVYDSSFGGPPADAALNLKILTSGPPHPPFAWSPDTPEIGSEIINLGSTVLPVSMAQGLPDESFGGGEDFQQFDLTNGVSRSSTDQYKGVLVPEYGEKVEDLSSGLSELPGNFPS